MNLCVGADGLSRVCFAQVTPGLGLIAVLLLLFVIKEPKRGAVEARPEHHLHQTSWLMDLLALSKKYVQRHYRAHASCIVALV